MANIFDQVSVELVVAVFVLVLGAWLIYCGLWRDRSRGRRRCPRCWYDLRGSPGMTCPECGHEARRERQLHKTRRDWRITIVGLILLLPSSYVLSVVYGWLREQVVVRHVNELFPSSTVAPVQTTVIAPAWLKDRLQPRWSQLYERVTSIYFDNATDEEVARLSSLHHLEVLAVAGPQVTGASLTRIAKMSRLHTLMLDQARITDQDLRQLADLSQLEWMSLSNTEIGDKGIEIISRLPKLKELYLAHTLITDAGLAHSTESHRLRELELSGTAITDSGLALLSDQTELESLDLDSTAITDDGMQYLRNMRQLFRLTLAMTKVTPSGLRQIEDLPNLRILSLSGPAVTDEGVEVLRRICAQSTFLMLKGQAVGDDQVKLIAGIPTINRLWLKDTSATDACLDDLVGAPSMTHVSVVNCPHVTQQAIERFEKAAPNVRVYYVKQPVDPH